ncbi:MAG: 50S ribosomal protein L28 [Patescibacteria group bacterium]|jgi:large subunit ribosomal protein L28
MSKICVITGKTPLTARNVSHSNVKTKRRQMPNLQKKTLVNPATGKPISLVVSGRGLRTLRKWAAEGIQVDLRNFVA